MIEDTTAPHGGNTQPAAPHHEAEPHAGHIPLVHPHHTQHGGLADMSEKDKGNYALALAVVVGLLIILSTVWLANDSFNKSVDATKQSYMNAKPGTPNPATPATTTPTTTTPTNPSAGTTPPSAALPTIDLSTRTFRGASDAPIWIFEIADYQCPYCVQAAPTVEQVMAKYNSSVRLVFVHFPLNSIHPLAQKAAEAAECANDQGKFWEYHDKLMATSPALDVPALKADAAALGLDTAKFNTCLDTGAKAPLIAAFVKLCTDSSITSTPTFIVNGETLSDRSFEGFDKKIQAILNPPRAVINTTGRPTWGNASAPVHIIEFSDFQCPYCEQAYQTVKSVEQNYAGKVSITFMEFPLSMHPLAQKAAEAAECANDQGKFWEYHDKLFTDRKLEVADLKSQAAEMGMNATRFNTCLDNGEKVAVVTANQALGTANGISGTPGFFLNGYALKGYLPYAQFKTYVDKELALVQNSTAKK